ncbi:MAG: M14 family metallopeptidase [Candidatus Aminicenantia bacterium]
MIKKIFLGVFILSFFILTVRAEINSLSELFLPGKILKDKDGDNQIDSIETQIILRNNPSLEELILASEIAARMNLESLAGNFALVKRESQIKDFSDLKNPIFIGKEINLVKKLIKKKLIDVSSLKKNQAVISLFSDKGLKGIVILGTSPQSLLFAGRAFFLRWPYLWEIWGRKQGATYSKVEKELKEFLKEKKIDYQGINIVSAIYQYEEQKGEKEAVNQFRFDRGEIKNLIIKITFLEEAQKFKAEKEFYSLIENHHRGEKTNRLNYPGCAQLTLHLKSKNKISQIKIERMGYPKRMLTPAYKPVPKIKVPERNFDLTNLFSEKGIFSDSNKDQIPDTLDSYLIISPEEKYHSIAELCSRLVIEVAGASFPIIKLDKEIDNYKKLISPILIGEKNALVKHLEKIGKFKKYPLKKDEGLIQIIPQAFNKSNALIIQAESKLGMEKTLSYLAKIYPYLTSLKAGEPQIVDLKQAIEEFLKGKGGSAASYFYLQLKNLVEKLKNKELEYFSGELYLPQENKELNKFLSDYLKNNLQAERIEIKSINAEEEKKIFEKEKEFTWEVEKGLKLIEEKINQKINPQLPLEINLGISESPSIRQETKDKIESLLQEKGISNFKIDVFSAYKQGFFWLWEKVLPEIKGKEISEIVIKFSEETPNLNLKKRFYSEPIRWLQELYPIDEIISNELAIPLEKINFERMERERPAYKVEVFNSQKELIFSDEFFPRIKERVYLDILPEWGKAKINSGWLEIKNEGQTILNALLETDLEKFWNFYQEEILPEVYHYIMKKTNQEPTFKKQPYFKRLLVELWMSEPDFRLGLDEEIVSSLEGIHDEIYFDTLDFLRGITKIEDEEELPEDTSRYSAPGNILPLIHSSTEGKKGRVRISFEDKKADTLCAIFKWKEKNKEERIKKINFAPLKWESISIPRLIYNGPENKIRNLLLKIKFKEEKDYLRTIDMVRSFKELLEKGLYQDYFSYPNLEALTFLLLSEKLEKEELLELVERKKEEKIIPKKEITQPIVPLNKIISPDECWTISQQLGTLSGINFYQAGLSYQKRKIPVFEIYLPSEKYVSYPKLITFKPTLYLSGRQHANEVSSTNYILKLAELLVTDENYKKYLKKMNFVLHPMENPDGAQLAYELQKITPFHSLHAGRYSALGIDIGYQVNVKNPILPEAKVRKSLYQKWLPDIYLNLHGYPSHEWVQQFSNYSPYLFRDYWIPRGWFAYYKYLRLPIYEQWEKAGEDLKNYIIQGMNQDEKIKKFNKKLYQRYYRWAVRWQPHLDYLEIDRDLNLYAERRSSVENKLTPRRKISFVEEVSEVMDETAQKDWLEFICQQGLTYLRTHLNYLAQVEYKIIRLEEEYDDRIQIKFIRARPGKIKKNVK